MKPEKPLLNLLTGKPTDRRPLWLMRQAGRYLPEYQALREKAGSFLNLCLNPALAAEVTLQPIRRFDFDAAILFADILLIPHAFGQKIDFIDGKGPVLEAVADDKALGKLIWNIESCAPVFSTLQRVSLALPDNVTLLGFAGGPWTVACYMIEGGGSKGFAHAIATAKDKKAFMQRLMDFLHMATLDYLEHQIAAGAEAIQIFDSWAGLLRGKAFQRWVIEPTQRLVAALKESHPNVPIIGFPRAASRDDYLAFAKKVGVDALSIDQGVPLDYAKKDLQPLKIIQGNLDPELLMEGGKPLRQAVDVLMKTMGPKHIINLGHGVLPQTPVEHIEDLIKQVRASPV